MFTDNPNMNRSRLIASIIGPIVAMSVGTEMLSMEIWEGINPRHVFLNGMILFSGGIVIVRFHPGWTPDWRSLVTFVGWFLMLAGTWRMAVPNAPQAEPTVSAYAMMAVFIAIGLFLTFKGYWPRNSDDA